MPQYMLLIYEDANTSPAPDSPEAQKEFAEYGTFTEDIRANGQFVSGAPLQTSETATTARSPRRRRRSAATTCSTAPTWTPRPRRRRGSRRRGTAPSRSAR